MPDEITIQPERIFFDTTGNMGVCRGDVKNTEDEPDRFVMIDSAPETGYWKYDGAAWVEDDDAKQAAIDAFVLGSARDFFKVIYKNFSSLPAGMKTMLAQWKSDADDFVAGL